MQNKRKIKNIILGVITLSICEIIFLTTGMLIMITLYCIGMLVVGIGIFKGLNSLVKLIGDKINGNNKK